MKKAGKSGKKATCVYEGENVPMKGRSTGFLTETDRGSPTKKAGKARKTPLWFMQGNLCL